MRSFLMALAPLALVLATGTASAETLLSPTVGLAFGGSTDDSKVTYDMSPGTVRLYGSAGLGLVKARVEDAAGLFELDSNELGLGVGGGIVVLPGSGHVGFQGDIRHFRNLTDPEPDHEFDVDFGNLDFWRGQVGLTFRF
jgi:hypothetical protein